MELDLTERSRCWCFTLNNHTEDEVTHLHTNIFEACIDFAAQEEMSRSGTPHIQGYLHFQHAKSKGFMRASMPRAHFERARKWQAAKAYCLKTKTRDGRRWEKNKHHANAWSKPTLDEFMTAAIAWFHAKYPSVDPL